MEKASEGGTKRFIVISCLIFFCVLTGGGFLVVYVFVPDASQPWHPIAALVLIGFPWAFWLFTYLYTCIKACCRRGGPIKEDHHISRRGGGGGGGTRKGGAAARSTSPGDSQVDSLPNGQRHVHFGAPKVTDQNNGQLESGRDSSIASRESEIPLTSSVS